MSVMSNKLDPLSFKTILLNYCSGEPWGTVGQHCQHIKVISQTFPRNTMQTTAVKSLPLGFLEEEKNRKTESNEKPFLN